jgi:hypothetical protein
MDLVGKNVPLCFFPNENSAVELYNMKEIVEENVVAFPLLLIFNPF